MKIAPIKKIFWALSFSFSFSLFALILPKAYVVTEILPHSDAGHNSIVLLDFPGVLSVDAKKKEIFECLRKSLNDKIAANIEISKDQKIVKCWY